MEPNVAPNSHVASRLFSLLALSVGLFIAINATPAHADAIEPNRCADNAEIHDDGDDANGSDEDSVALGCGANVQQEVTKTGTDTEEQPLFTLDAGNDGTVDEYLVQVNCDNSDAGVCAGRTGDQLVSISKALHDRLRTVGDDVAEADGVRTAGPLTEAEMGMLTTALMDEKNVRPLSDVAVGLNKLTDTGVDVMRSASTDMSEVADGTAVGAEATVKADGGIAIGNGATVGADETTTVTLTMDPDLGVLVVGYEETSTGGGGDNGIAIGNGASATGDGSIAIGNGAEATEDGQVVIGGHDIGDMADSVAGNTAAIASNTTAIASNTTKIGTAITRLDAHDKVLEDHNDRLQIHGEKIDENRENIGKNTDRIMNNGKRIDGNREMINENKTKIGNNGKRIDGNREMINGNTTKIGNNAKRIDGNREMINGNTTKIANNTTRIDDNREMIDENKEMLGTHATMIGTAMTRLDGHATAITALDGRVVAHGATLSAHDQRLDAHDQVLMGHAAGIDNNATRIQMLDDRVSQAAAAAAALSAVPNAPDMDEQFFVGVGVGSHGGESSVAAGISGRLGANKNIVVNAGIANSGDGTSVRAGVGWSF